MVDNILVSDLGETALLAALFIIFETFAQTLRTVVEGITEWLVDTVKDIMSGHEDALKGR